MKLLISFVLALATAAGYSVEPSLTLRNVEMPVMDIEGRITNGNTASVGQFPYQVGLSLRLASYSSSWCGGSLIGNQWVLTAAHCTTGAVSVTVYLGATVRTSAEATQIVGSSNIIIHSGYNKATLMNDISLIRIAAVTYSSKIKAVKLPAIASSYTTYAGQYAIASGWGRTSDATNSITSNLQWARLEIITNAACAQTYGSSIVVGSNICIGTPRGTSTCQGDSGGPLVLESNSVQIGLTSFGALAGCEKGYPVAFTRLTSYLSWIKSNTGISY